MSLRRTFLILIALAALLAIWGYATAVSVPIVRQARLDLPRWPAGAPPVKAVLISDIHVIGPDMPRSGSTALWLRSTPSIPTSC